MIQLEEQKEKRLKKNEQFFSELWENVKHVNVCSVDIQKERTERDGKNREIMAYIFQIWWKTLVKGVRKFRKPQVK